LKIFKNSYAITTLMKRNYFMRSLIVTSLLIAIAFTNVNLFAKVTAESGVGKDVFKVIVTLFGITNSTKDITTLVNVKDQTKVKVFNAENPETEGQDKESYTITFPNVTVNDGDPYTVCTVSVENFELNCNEGNNSPLNRPEFVDIDVAGGGGGSEDEGEEE
jgi:hypothetical protein